MIDILLINPPMWSPQEQAAFNDICPPLGLGYLAACLVKAGISVDIVDLNVSDEPEKDLRSTLDKISPRMVGITTLTQNFHLALRVAKIVKLADRRIFVAMGGPHTTYKWRETLAHAAVDAVLRFEGEKTLVELFRQLSNDGPDLSSIEGIAFSDGEHLNMTADRPQEEHLDEIPYPERELLPMERYARAGTIMTSRGCPCKCIFCLSSTYEGKYRMRSPESVIEELAEIRNRYGIREVYFLDNVFTVDAERVWHICQLIIERDLGIRFSCVSRVDLITRELVEMLKAAGCRAIEIGVESGDQEIIDAMKKHIPLNNVPKVADIVLGAGIQPMFTFQFGSPYDTDSTISKTRRLASEVRRKGAVTFFSIMTPFPGTPLAEKADEFNIQIHAKDWSAYRTSNPVYDTKYLDRASFRRALYQEATL